MSTYLVGSETFDATSLIAGAQESEDITVTGAALGDYVTVSLDTVDIVDLALTATVTAANVVTAVLLNETAGTIDLGSGTLRVRVTTLSGAHQA